MADEILNDEEILEEEIGDELGEEIGEEIGEELSEEPVGTVLSHTIEEIPELEGLTTGDTLTLRISNQADNKFDLEVLSADPGLDEEAEFDVEGSEALTEKFI